MESQTFTRFLLLSCSGPIIWALHFVAIYGFVGVVCARPQWDWQWMGVQATSWGVAAAGVVALGAIAAFALRAWSHREHPGEHRYFLAYATVGLALLSALAVVYETLTVWLVPSCV